MRKIKFGKKLAASAAALAMIATSSAASVASMTAFAGELLGEGTFNEGAGLPWHICENGTAEMAFEINNGVYAIQIKNPGGQSNGGEDRWDCQFRHRQLSITYGHKYRMTYSVYATNSGHMYSKIGDVTNDDAEYWHNCGNKLDIGGYTAGISQADLETKLKNASCSKDTNGNANTSDWDVPYYMGWNSWSEDTIPAKTWKTYAWEFIIDKSFMSNIDNHPDGKNTVEWTFHFGGDGTYTPSPCFPAGTVIKFDNLALIDMTGEGDNWVEPEEKVQRDIVLNQVGFYPNLQKQATVEGMSASSFEVKDASGKTVYTGPLSSAITDATAGETVQIADFSDFTTEGTGYYIQVGDKQSLPFDIGNDIYDGLVTDAMNYYYLNRSGMDLSDQYVSDSKGHYSNNPHDADRTLGRKAGHKPDTAYISDEWVYIYTSEPTYTKSIDVTGGWYDAGDYGKYVVNGGVSMWTLGNTYERALYAGKEDKWADGSGTVKIPETGNGTPDILDEMMWEADFFETMQRDDGMVYHKIHDYKWTGLGVMPYVEEGVKEETTNPKRIVKPATYAATLNAAASWAQLARLLKPYNETKANEYIAAAEKAYKAAKSYFVKNYGDIYADVDGDYTKDDMFAPLEQNKGGGPYGDTQVSDEFYWASTELFLTTGGSEYGTDMRAYKDAFTVPTHVFGGENKGDPTAFTWGTLEALGTMSYAVQKNNANADAAEIKKSSEAVQAAADYYLDVEKKSGYGTDYEGQDMSAEVTVFNEDDSVSVKTIDMTGAYGWGSNSMVANNAIVMGIAYDLSGETSYLNGVSSAFDYILGRNAMENSYVTGWGTETTNYPHHRYWCPQMKAGWPYAPSGCLSGGPNSNMNDPMIQGAGYKIGELAPQKCYYDQNDAWSVNEITINWNAPLVWVSSFMEDEGPNGTSVETDILWGDADCSGEVDILDVITLNKAILGKESLTAQGEKNADVNQSGAPDSSDALNIMKLIVRIYTQDDMPLKK